MSSWCICCNVQMFDIVGAVNDDKGFYWRKNVSIQKGDVVYIYVSRPYSKIMYKAIVVEDKLDKLVMKKLKKYLKVSYEDLKEGTYMQIKILGEFVGQKTHFNFVTKEGLNTIQGPSKLKEDILNYLEQTQHETAEYKEV